MLISLPLRTESSGVLDVTGRFFGASSAHADDISKARRQEAGLRFERGLAFFDAGQNEKALAEFQAAYRLAPHHNVLLNIAITQKAMFRYRDALESLERSLSEGKGKMSRKERREVEKERVAIRALMATVRILTRPDGARVTIDGKSVGKTPFKEPVLLGPGKHTIEVAAPGYKNGEKTVDVSAGDTSELRIALQPMARNVGILTIRTKPVGAQLSIDGLVIGNSPWTGERKPGGQRVRAVLRDYEPQEKEVLIAMGQNRTVSMELKEKVVKTPFYKKWYFWAGVVTVAAAGAATYVILTQDRPDAELKVDVSMPSLVRF